MENNTKNQVIDRLKQAQNILVTVSNNPNVDQLAAALGFTLMMNKLDKRATAVFSGDVPSTLEFLKPEETIETNTDSLRDFIIALDKSKADKLKYKVEDDVVKVFITPYKTSLSEVDLNFSQGDFNVDVVIALGVENKDHIDKAIMAHGRILHDATVIAVSNNENALDIGSIQWQDTKASSLCEMLASTSEKFKNGVVDGQIATAFLTGIVSETDRFSNEKTSPKVMTLSAQLMAAGANQQLISTELTPEPVFQPAYDEFDESRNPDLVDNMDDAGDIVSPEGVLTLNHDDITVDSDDVPGAVYNNDAIAIDTVGNFKSADELNTAVSEVQATAEESSRPAPGAEEKNGGYPKYYETPDVDKNPLNANLGRPEEEARIDPLADIPASNPLGNNSPGSTQSPFLSTQHDAESVSAIDVPITPDQSQRLASDGESNPNKPLGPQVNTNGTLEDIEKSVMSFEESGSGMPLLKPTPQAVADDSQPKFSADSEAESARQAVVDAVNQAGDYNPERPQPIESLGAVEFSEPNVVAPELQVVESAGPPPPVPPPFVPPFPTYDPNDPNQKQ